MFAVPLAEMDMRVDDAVKKTVVFLGDATSKPFAPHGTGFIVSQPIEFDSGYQSVVTARHVIEGIKSKIVHMRVNDRQGEAVVVPLPKEGWFCHPDPKIDAAVFPCILNRDQYDILHIPIGPYSDARIPNNALTEEAIKRHQVGIGDEVYIAGMFVGRLGEKQNIPILRIGTIAAMTGEAIATQYGYHDAYLVEVTSIDGLSGSPVCVHLLPDRLTAPGGFVIADPRFRGSPDPGGYFLMGMVLGYNEVLNPTDNILIPGRHVKTDRRRRKVLAPMNTGIAVVVPISKIIETLDQPIIKQKRADAMKEAIKFRRFVPTSVPESTVVAVEPSLSNENPQHREDFTSLLNAAAKKKPQDDQT
jgi:hypothetical protein